MGDRDADTAREFTMDLAARLDRSAVPQITLDGLVSYVSAVEEAFGADVHYAQTGEDLRDVARGGRQARA